jgi:predicted protein tyrosine phosphatase
LIGGHAIGKKDLMPRIYVCSLSQVAATVSLSEASHLVTLLHRRWRAPRPETIPEGRHLFIGVSDISAPVPGFLEPSERHVLELIAFVSAWDQVRPMVMHCFAGISRSTAGAFIALCYLNPDDDEEAIAQRLRHASAVASPNKRFVEVADAVLGRGGRMIEAIRTIGPGAFSLRNKTFVLPIASEP